MRQTGRAQKSFVFRTWGGRRANAGRKPLREKAGVSHRRRELLASRFAVHVTLRVCEDLPNLRGKACIRSIEAAFLRSARSAGFRLVHYSVQQNHLHLLCEARDALHLSRGVQGLAIRLARGLNKVCQRQGKVFADRFHSRILRTPREVRAVLVYLLGNARRHGKQRGRVFDELWLDPCSSARFFDGWQGIAPPPLPNKAPVAPPRTWLVRQGWRRHGLLAPQAVPGSRPGGGAERGWSASRNLRQPPGERSELRPHTDGATNQDRSESPWVPGDPLRARRRRSSLRGPRLSPPCAASSSMRARSASRTWRKADPLLLALYHNHFREGGAVMVVFAFYGLRLSDVAALRLDDIY